MGDRGLLEEFALKAASAPARVPSFDGWEELSGEWMRKPTCGSVGMGP